MSAEPIVSHPDAPVVSKTKLFSPNQVAVAAFFGGPAAAVYVLWKNFAAVGKDQAAKLTIWFGSGLTVLILAIVPFLPDSFPNSALPAAYTVTAWQVARTYQVSKQQISVSEQYEFQSNWTVAGIAVAFLIALVLVIVAELLLLDQLGVVPL
jgi:hypothetical protein